MTFPVIATPPIIIPENAPFSPEQRAWLSGFLAATLLAEPTGATPLAEGEAQQLALPAAGPVLASNDDAPWHDPAMALEERMKHAEGKPLAPKLMAAMAQQDCGQCGYNCADYANALFQKKEERLNLCAPGGKETARMLKLLAVELGAANATANTTALTMPAISSDGEAKKPGRCREQPVEARFIERRKLNGPGSEKDTWHVEFDLSDSGIDYVVGESLGIFPANDLGLVDQIIAMLGVSHTADVNGRALRDVLKDKVSLGAAPDTLFELISYVTGGTTREKARVLARGENPDGDAAALDVMAALQKFPGARMHPEAFVDALEPMHPRLYSISSSPKRTPGQISLTVDSVRYVVGKRQRLGVASTFLADRVAADTKVKVYVQKAHNFALPQDSTKPIIMVGPGTGIAPFRAFLQERQAVNAPGKNWLFFGHQHVTSDFFYKDELEALRKTGVLTRLSLAWSRDDATKFYLQDRMREVGAALWQWLAEGVHFYVCGDAKRMAKDVEAALVDIVAQHGARSIDEAVAFVGNLKKVGRYQADVY
jgi:sulfite reductase (NADPH) flavoprotein alpha-component